MKKIVEFASCKSYKFDICIFEKPLEDALENKNSEKHALTINPNRNRYAPNYNKKNKSKRTRRVWVEKGIAYSINSCVATCFCNILARYYLYKYNK